MHKLICHGLLFLSNVFSAHAFGDFLPDTDYDYPVFNKTKDFRWIYSIDYFDCVCGITANGIPIGIGVFFDLNLVLTSATSIEPYLEDIGSLQVHAIHGAHDKSVAFNVQCAVSPYNNDRTRKNIWHPLGLDGKHSGIHDLKILYAHSHPRYYLAPEAANASYRHAFSIFLARPENVILRRGFYIPGFGYIDEEHVMAMNDMEAEIYNDAVLVDCDDYIPRDWGLFICIKNPNMTAGVQSGSPLIQRKKIYGIGSFTVQKGEENIFVFTDIRPYVSSWAYCFNEGEHFPWKSRYWR